MRKRVGPRLDPCGTLEITWPVVELSSSMTTLCSITEEAPDPVLGLATHAVVVQFQEQSLMRHLVEGFGKIKKHGVRLTSCVHLFHPTQA